MKAALQLSNPFSFFSLRNNPDYCGNTQTRSASQRVRTGKSSIYNQRLGIVYCEGSLAATKSASCLMLMWCVIGAKLRQEREMIVDRCIVGAPTVVPPSWETTWISRGHVRLVG